MYSGTHGVQKRVTNPLKLGLQEIVSHSTWVLALWENSTILTAEPSLQTHILI